MASTPPSPKVHAAGGAGAVTIVVLWALNNIGAVASLPVDVKVALATIVVGAVTWLAGYIVTDPNRIVLDLERIIQRTAGLAAQSAVRQSVAPAPVVPPAPAPATKRTQKGAVDVLTVALVALIVVVILVLLGVLH